MLDYFTLSIVAILWFFGSWIGYAWFAKYKAKRTFSLSSVMNRQRLHWMELILERDLRVADAAILANLERNTSFLASTSIFIVAGLLTMLGIVETIDRVLQTMPFYIYRDDAQVWIYGKIFLLIVVYIYAFFSLTWSMRQYGFGSVMVGAAPMPEAIENNEELAKHYIRASSKVIDMAGHAYNYGLRAYYFSLAILPWFISPLLFMLSTSLVVVILYIREFKSKPFMVLKEYELFLESVSIKNPKLYEPDTVLAVMRDD